MISRIPASVFLVTALPLGGCASIGQIAPSVTPAMIAASGGALAADLERGRHIFAGPCASCHSVDPVGKYSIARWREIVGDMAERAELSASDKSALLAYLNAATAIEPPR